MAELSNWKGPEMTDIINRVAREIEGIDTSSVEGARLAARAAIAAMREPTPEMIEAGLDAYEFWGRTAEHVADDWRDMIDAALKETDNG